MVRADEERLRFVRRPDEEAILEKVERDRQCAKADLRIARESDIGMAVAHRGDDLGHLHDDLVPRQRRNLRVETVDHGLKLFARNRVIEILVNALHFAGHEMQIVAPRLSGRDHDRNL